MKFQSQLAFTVLIALIFLSSCTDVRQKTLQNIAKQAEFADIKIYDSGDTPGDPVVFRINDVAEINKLVTFASAKETEQFKCGYSGAVDFLQEGVSLLEMEFNLNDDCQHIAYTTVDGTYFSELTLEGLKYFQDKSERATAQFQAKESILRMDWLQGKWAYITKRIAFTEEWSMNPDGSMSGKGETREQGQEPISEAMSIEASNGDIYYTADVPNNDEPIKFLLTEQTDSLLVFENPDHDMPKLIAYERQSDGILHAWIQGDPGSGDPRMDFYFVIQTIVVEE